MSVRSSLSACSPSREETPTCRTDSTGRVCAADEFSTEKRSRTAPTRHATRPAVRAPPSRSRRGTSVARSLRSLAAATRTRATTCSRMAPRLARVIHFLTSPLHPMRQPARESSKSAVSRVLAFSHVSRSSESRLSHRLLGESHNPPLCKARPISALSPSIPSGRGVRSAEPPPHYIVRDCATHRRGFRGSELVARFEFQRVAAGFLSRIAPPTRNSNAAAPPPVSGFQRRCRADQ